MAEMSLSDECDSGKDDEEVEQTQNFVYFFEFAMEKNFFSSWLWLCVRL